MTPNFHHRCEAVFTQSHGRRWKSACADALGIGRATLYRYLEDPSGVPNDVLEALARLETPARPTRTDADMAKLMAVAVVRLRQSLDENGWLKPPYHPDIQRFLDLCAARNIAEEADIWPSSLALLVRRAREPLASWMPGTAAWDPHGTVTEEPLIEGEQTTPTCRELASDIEGHSPEDELVETRGFAEFRQACLAQKDGQPSYATWRRFVVDNPVVASFQRVVLTSPDLTSIPGLQDAFQNFYEPLPAAFAEGGRVPICRVSGTVLRRDGTGYQTESRDPEAVRLARAGDCDHVEWTPSMRVLRRPFRTFWCLPGKAEVELMDRLRGLGWEVEAWPKMDMVDLAATSPDGTRRIAVDVKDYASPALLAARFDGFKAYERTHDCYLVVPDAQTAIDRRYAAVFYNLRVSLGRKEVALRSVSQLVSEIRRDA